MDNHYSTKKIQRRISVLANVCIVSTCVLIGILSITPFYSNITEYQSNLFQQNLENEASQIETSLQSIRSFAFEASQSAESIESAQKSADSLDPAQTISFQKILASNSSLSAIYRFSMSGEFIAGSNQNLSKLPEEFQNGLNYIIQKKDNYTNLLSLAQVRAPSGELLAYDVYEIDLGRHFSQQELLQNLGKSDQVYLLDGNSSIILARGGSSKSAKFSYGDKINFSGLNDSQILYQTKLPAIGWSVFRIVPKAIALAGVNEKIEFALSIGFLLMVMGCVTICYLLQPLTDKFLLQADDLNKEIDKKTYELQSELNQKKLAERALKASNETLVVNDQIINNTLAIFDSKLSDLIRKQKDRLNLLAEQTLPESAKNTLQESALELSLLEQQFEALKNYTSRDFDLYKFTPAIFNLDQVLDSWLQLLKSKCDHLKRQFKVNRDHGIKEQLVGDPSRIGQTLAYLIDENLQKSLPDADIEISIAHKKVAEDEILLELAVKCDGMVYDEDLLLLLNRHFDKLEDSGNYSKIRPAMNLLLCAKLAKSHGGKLALRKSSQGGTEFKVSMPFLYASSGIISSEDTRLASGAWKINTKPTKSTAIMRPDCHPIKILLAENSKISEKLISNLLATRNCQIKSVNSPNEVHAALDQDNFDMIFLDTGLLIGDPVDLAETIRASHHNKIPIIALGSEEQKTNLLQNGIFNDFIEKPIDPHSLFKSVSRWS